jgi:hypothetical protein
VDGLSRANETLDPFSLHFSLSASKDLCDVEMHTARLVGSKGTYNTQL